MSIKFYSNFTEDEIIAIRFSMTKDTQWYKPHNEMIRAILVTFILPVLVTWEQDINPRNEAASKHSGR